MSDSLLDKDLETAKNTMPAGVGSTPTLQKAAWGMGGFADNFIWNGISTLALPIYNIALGVSPILLGYALAIPRILDAVVDPLIGNLSDNTRTRWGRRRPFIAIGALVMAIFFALLWLPPLGLGKSGLFWYFFVVSIIMLLAYPFWAIAHNALGYELSTDYHERTRIMAWRMVFMSASGFVLPWMYKLTMLPVFGGKEVIGIRYIGPAAAVLIFVAAFLPAVICRERNEIQSQPKVKILSAIKMTLTNRPFLILNGMIFFVLVGLNLAAPFALYINIYYICQGSKEFASMLMGYYGTLQSVAYLAGTPLAAWLSVRWGKKNLFIFGLSMSAVGFALNWVMFTPAHPYWQLIPIVLIFPGQAFVWVLAPSMIADICDVDELNNGLRREGMFGAVCSQICKASVAGVTVAAGYMLRWSGYVEKAVQTPDTLLKMRLIYLIVPVAFLVLAAVLAMAFPLTEKSAREVRAALDARVKRDKPEEARV